MTEKETNTARDLMYAWKKGWPSYIPNDKSDHPAILRLANTCAKIAKVFLDEEEGYMRIKQGLANIAAFCSESPKWKDKIVSYITESYQNVLLEMNAWRKAKASEKKIIEENYHIGEERRRKQQEDFILSERSRVQTAIDYINTWNITWQLSYKKWIESNKTIVLSYDESELALKKLTHNKMKRLKREVLISKLETALSIKIKLK